MRRLIVLFARAQNRLATLLGCPAEQRAALVGRMLERDLQEATAYWLQLLVSVCIATLGLVLGSTAVVIGAMLIAPLMGPIVNLGMGLAVGSPVLVLRAGARVLLSVGVVLVSSAMLTVFLPFHEVNSEIAARVHPTALDLLVAAACAVAGVYAALRPGSDTASTAAGTSIGISLVPPLCVSGFGVGTTDARVAGGALLLFVTNFVAIVVVSTVAFVGAGFNQVDASALDAEELAREKDETWSRLLARRLAAVFGSSSGPWLRLLMPLGLLGILYVPLRSALDEVAWQVRTRAGIQRWLDGLQEHLVDRRIRVEGRQVDVALVLIGSQRHADELKVELEDRIREMAQVKPRIVVLAIADATAVAGLESALSQRAALPTPTPAPLESWERSTRAIRERVERRWPRQSAGELLALLVDAAEGPTRILASHLGPSLDPSARETLERVLSEDLARPVSLTDESFPSVPLETAALDASFLSRVAPVLIAARNRPQLSVCIERPELKPPRRAPVPQSPLEVALRELAEGSRVSWTSGQAWVVRFVRGPCAPEDARGEGAPGVP